jgi:hypothetical protein
MPLRARVGRHTRNGGRHCQNWPDDHFLERLVPDLLEKKNTQGNGGNITARAGPSIG